ncbi:K(+)-transporting ATPase subunit F [Pseudonocardia sp. RS11V-5]|nr:K(+)-transporting ATPase subunit F [Pseudonocardia terrae]MCE3554536.1 K(+)-transporting ATPase subunit F [Pseudonocardia terrae]
MSTGEVVTNVVGGVVALALLVYLVVALLRPERF